MMRILGLSLVLASVACSTFANPVSAPEIDGGSTTSALVLLSGGLLVLRARFKK